MRQRLRLVALAALAVALGPGAPPLGAHGDRPHPTLFRNGLWYDGRAFVRRDVIVADGTIGGTAAAVDTVDLGGGWVVPAFADAHSHVFSDTAGIDAQVRRFVQAGILYAKNPNNPGTMVEAVRAVLRAPGAPQVVFANGGLTSPGGHPVQIYEGEAAAAHGARRFAGDAYVEVADAAALAAAWPNLLARRPDLIKVYLEHSEEHARRRDDPAFLGRRGLDPALLTEVVARAHAAGLPVTAHVTSAADFRAAVGAGVDEIGHLPLEPISEADARAAARRGVTVVTTSVSHRPAPPGVALDTLHRANLARLVRAGTRLALGTDHPALTVIDEAENLKRIGAFDEAALVRLLAVDTPRAVFPRRRVGSLEPGAEATFLVLQGDPTRDLGALRRIALRVARGAVIRPAPVKPSVAEAMMPLLLRGDVDGALALYDRLRAAHPDSLSFAEQELNGLGYGLLRHRQPAMAVAIFRKNTEQFPGSANAWDSLADGCLAAGDTTAAQVAWRGVLERAPADPKLDAERRRGLEERARAGLAGR